MCYMRQAYSPTRAYKTVEHTHVDPGWMAGFCALLGEALESRRRRGICVHLHHQMGCSHMEQRDELICIADHDAAPTTSFATAAARVLQRGGFVQLGVAGCALTAATHRRSKRQREHVEVEREKEP